jgi:hypothetical protein
VDRARGAVGGQPVRKWLQRHAQGARPRLDSNLGAGQCVDQRGIGRLLRDVRDAAARRPRLHRRRS